MQNQSAWQWLTTGAGVTVIGAVLLYLGQRFTARAAERATRSAAQLQGEASVQVARITAASATEGHLWEQVRIKDECIEALRQECETCHAEVAQERAKRIIAESELVNLKKELERMQALHEAAEEHIKHLHGE